MIIYIKQKIQEFFKSNKRYTILTMLVAGLYALLYYYDKNYPLLNSKSQFAFLVGLYIVLPLVSFFAVDVVFKSVGSLKPFRKYVLSVFNICTFLLTIVISLFGFDNLKLVIALVLGILLGILLFKHIKKVVVLQILMIGLVSPKLVPDLYREITYSKDWMKQPDSIEKAKFKAHPNIYVIQPDGYANFATLRDSIHNYDNSTFEHFLKNSGFTLYENFRSNYFSTLTSNSSLFGMKHHYYGNTDLGINPRHNRRNEIVESNPVLRTLKHNGYKTFLMLQVPYILSNRPRIDYDYCNISLDEISYISRGFSGETNLIEETKTQILENKESSNFFFIESMLPSHVVTHYNPESSVENERRLYFERIEKANDWLKDLVDFIEKEDPNALVVIAADHGGFVGFDYSLEAMKKSKNPLLVNSIFASALAIKWPNIKYLEFDKELRSSVNLFRILFAYLSEDKSYLTQLQDDKSFMLIREGAPTAVYEYIDEQGNVVFHKK